MFGKKSEEEIQKQEPVSHATISKFYKMANDLYLTSENRIYECETLIIYLEKNIMDQNEENLDDENQRKLMRPLTNELMNQIKMNRNLLKLLLQDIDLMHSKNTELSNRLVIRFMDLCKEITNIDTKMVELAVEFNNKFSQFLDKNAYKALTTNTIKS